MSPSQAVIRLWEASDALAAAGGRRVAKSVLGFRALGWLLRALGVVVAVLSLGRLRGLGAGFAAAITTIGPWVGVPDDFDARPIEWRVEILTHETVHVRQFRWAGCGSPVLGIPVLAVVYLLLPLPLGVAYGRYRLELAAYVAGYRARLALRPQDRERCVEWGTEALGGPDYGWAWPRRWVRRALEARL